MSETSGGMENPQRNQSRFELRGRLQIETARDALDRTGHSPGTAETLTIMLNHHRKNGDQGHNGDENILSLRLLNDEEQKEEILDSLHEVAEDETAPRNLRVASETLHEILTRQEAVEK